MSVYMDFAAKTSGGVLTNEERFERDIVELAARDDVLMAVFADDNDWYERVTAIAPETMVLPVYTQRISRADPHPNAAGHRQIAAAMVEGVREFEARMCEGE